MRIFTLLLFLSACTARSAPPEDVEDNDAFDAQSFDLSTVEEAQAVSPGWTAEQRSRFSHIDQGTPEFPYAWLLALEQATNKRPFIDPTHVRELGLIPANKSVDNPDGLPVGFSQTMVGSEKMAGFTCALCHTTELVLGGKRVRIDGGPTHADIDDVAIKLGTALAFTAANPVKLRRFVKRLETLEDKTYGFTDVLRLEADIAAFVQSKYDEVISPYYLVKAGPARSDALGKGGNRAFAKMMDERNWSESHSNLSIPFIWDAPRLDWVNYNNSTRQNFGRNVTEAIAVGANIELRDPSTLFSSTTSFDGLVWIERTLEQLESPVWPLAVDDDRIAAGRAVYQETCSGCHGAVGDDNLITPLPSVYGVPGDIDVPLFALDDILTDPTDATMFADRTVFLSPAVENALGLSPGTKVSAADAFTAVTDAMMKPYLASFTAQEADAITRGRSNDWQSLKAVRARPLDGAWATAPFLHNGSVATMYELLSPQAQRREVFQLGGADYDPIFLGYETGDFTFDTRKPGNSNSGHSFEASYDMNRPWTAQDGLVGRRLSHTEKMAVIELLKVARLSR